MKWSNFFQSRNVDGTDHFIIYTLGVSYPCDRPTEGCSRTEFYGFQYGHLFFYILIGFMYPKQFWTWITIGMVWELFEYWFSQNPELVYRFGGCLSHSDEETPLWMRKVYAGRPKYENFIDRAFGIQNSQVHKWHYSIGENVTNVVGFMIGFYIRDSFFT